MQLRQILASTCRQRILETLVRTREIHIMELVRKTNSTYCGVRRNLAILEKESIVGIEAYGRMKVIRLNRESEKAKILIKAIHILDTPISESREIDARLQSQPAYCC